MSIEIAQPVLLHLPFRYAPVRENQSRLSQKNWTISRLMKRPISKRARDDRSYASLSIDA